MKYTKEDATMGIRLSLVPSVKFSILPTECSTCKTNKSEFWFNVGSVKFELCNDCFKLLTRSIQRVERLTQQRKINDKRTQENGLFISDNDLKQIYAALSLGADVISLCDTPSKRLSNKLINDFNDITIAMQIIADKLCK